MLPLGTSAPAFNLPDVVNGQQTSLETFSSNDVLLVMFICRHCPYVKHVQHQIAQLGVDYKSKNVGIVAISSNDADAYPDDSPENLRAMARSYGAVCTPDFFVFDKNRNLAYRGRLDGSRPRSTDPVTGEELRAAINALLNGGTVSSEQWPSIGCNIKWRS
jgi:thiol-disulfide isomerase/thioredoxin